MCYVSHAEMLRIFQRACARAGIPLAHSLGFNPRPRLSLPLPRSVGVESDDELLQIRVDVPPVSQGPPCRSESEFDARKLMADLAEHLPDGCELTSAALAQSAAPPQPASATYVLTVDPDRVDAELEERVRSILESKSLPLERRGTGRRRPVRTIDVRGFLKSVELRDEEIIIECSIGPAGSIRIEEIMNLLNLGPAALAAPVRRTNVQWLKN